MKTEFIKKEGSKSLILVFAGWAMNANLFRNIHTDNDLAVCYDYRDMTFNKEIISTYNVIHIIAWSMGVWAVDFVSDKLDGLKISSRTAINGTKTPIDDERGIQKAVFSATLNNLSEPSMRKFTIRMCGDKVQYEFFLNNAPNRNIEEIKEELRLIEQYSSEKPASNIVWDRVFIGKNDHIFLQNNQQKAWEKHTKEMIIVDEAHYNSERMESIIKGADKQA